MGAMIIGGSECMGRTCRGLCAKYSIMSWRASVFSAVHACSSVQADRMLQQLPLLDYTDCNHGQGLAALHPALYRHMLPEAEAQFARMAVEVWGIDPKGRTREALANAFIDALSAFIREIGLPATLGEMGITADTDLRSIADTTILTGGCCKRFTHDELYGILKESL